MSSIKNPRAAVAILAVLLAACSPPPSNPPEPTAPQAPVAASLADYQRAEQFLSANTGELVENNILAQYWQSEGRLIYRRSTNLGSDYVLVDVASGAKQDLFDATALVAALAQYTEEELDADDLVLGALKLDAASSLLEFSFDGDQYSLNRGDNQLVNLGSLSPDEYLSPDASKAVFIEDHNLWQRDTASNELTQLTFDGEQDYGYGTNNAGWVRDAGPVLLWSPDSSKIATFRHDGRGVREMYLYNTKVGHVDLDAWKYPLPGDEHIFMIERVVIHLDDEPKLVRLAMPPDPHRSTISDHVAGRGGLFLDVQWSEAGDQLAFVSSSRDHKIAQLRVADPLTGEVRDVFQEEAATYYEAGLNRVNWHVLKERNEFIWFSEQDNWGHLYLHDLETGALKAQITAGNWNVLQVHKVDVENEHIYFLGSNREPGDPYYQYLYRVSFDGSDLQNLTPQVANHAISWSPELDYFTDTASTPIEPPVAQVRSLDGEVIALEQTDIEPLLAAGWIAPIPFIAKARDQLTDLYGLMYKPSNFDASRSYPILNYLYPGPQTGSVGTRSFRASRSDKQALAELGFIVVEVDAMGTPGRSKAFHDAYYGDMGDNGLPDQITVIAQLAAENSWMDLDRVGIWGASGGGFASTAGLLRYPDFYKVAVSAAGNHDNRNYEDDWAEKWQGLLETYEETDPLAGDTAVAASTATTNYDSQANQLLVENLEGKLLLAHGLMDTNVHPSNTLLVVDALIAADKDFDLLVLPNSGHSFGNRRYFMKRRWDYFVEHLQGVEPSSGFVFADNIR